MPKPDKSERDAAKAARRADGKDDVRLSPAEVEIGLTVLASADTSSYTEEQKAALQSLQAAFTAAQAEFNEDQDDDTEPASQV